MPTNREKLISELARDEDVRLKPYRDTVGKLTVGIGHNIDDIPLPKHIAECLQERGEITPEMCTELVNLDIDRTLEALAGKSYFEAVKDDPVRSRVIINMAFNMGVETLDTFKRTMSVVAAGHFELAASYMLQTKWASQVGKRAERLAQMMKTGFDHS